MCWSIAHQRLAQKVLLKTSREWTGVPLFNKEIWQHALQTWARPLLSMLKKQLRLLLSRLASRRRKKETNRYLRRYPWLGLVCFVLRYCLLTIHDFVSIHLSHSANQWLGDIWIMEHDSLYDHDNGLSLTCVAVCNASDIKQSNDRSSSLRTVDSNYFKSAEWWDSMLSMRILECWWEILGLQMEHRS